MPLLNETFIFTGCFKLLFYEGVLNLTAPPLKVNSEIGRLQKVLVHRPGLEVERLTPDLLSRLLFDDIPYLEAARREHDFFADLLSDKGVEVLYLENLAAEALEKPEVRQEFMEQFLDEGGIGSQERRFLVMEYLDQFSTREMVVKLMAGIKKNEIPGYQITSLHDRSTRDYPFLLDPMPNLYFTRDPFSIIGTGLSLNNMRTATRNRETIFAEYIFNFHPEYGDSKIPQWYSRYEEDSLEGGDQLVLSSEILAVGISQRTDPAAIEKFAARILSSDQGFDTVLALKIPAKRAFMHLDTVFTMVDYDKFTIHAEIEGPLEVYSLRLDGEDQLKINQETATLEEILQNYLGLYDVKLIRCAGGDPIDSGREQWNDGSNTLAIAPGEVIVYDRNYVTNSLLEESGVELNLIPSSELSRGRGGPRCMSMPFYRDPVEI